MAHEFNTIIIATFFLIVLLVTIAISLKKEKKYNCDLKILKYNNSESVNSFSKINDFIINTNDYYTRMTAELYNPEEFKSNILELLAYLKQIPFCFKNFHEQDKKRLDTIITHGSILVKNLEQDISDNNKHESTKTINSKFTVLKSFFTGSQAFLDDLKRKTDPT